MDAPRTLEDGEIIAMISQGGWYVTGGKLASEYCPCQIPVVRATIIGCQMIRIETANSVFEVDAISAIVGPNTRSTIRFGYSEMVNEQLPKKLGVGTRKVKVEKTRLKLSNPDLAARELATRPPKPAKVKPKRSTHHYGRSRNLTH